MTARRPTGGRIAVLRRRLRQVHGGDDGTTLLELTVGMSLMAVFMAVFTGAVLMMFNAVNTSQAINDTASQINTAFLQLDETVRSASSISTPGLSNGSWYVELRSTYTAADTCTQLRLNNVSKQLQSRTWTVTNGVASTAGAWRPIASGFVNGAAAAGTVTQPFVLAQSAQYAAAVTAGVGPSQLMQQLVVTLVPPSGPGIGAASATSLPSTFTVTALNSSLPAPTTPNCQQQGRP